jgi:hypothetical protein
VSSTPARLEQVKLRELAAAQALLAASLREEHAARERACELEQQAARLRSRRADTAGLAARDERARARLARALAALTRALAAAESATATARARVARAIAGHDAATRLLARERAAARAQEERRDDADAVPVTRISDGPPRTSQRR